MSKTAETGKRSAQQGGDASLDSSKWLHRRASVNTIGKDNGFSLSSALLLVGAALVVATWWDAMNGMQTKRALLPVRLWSWAWSSYGAMCESLPAWGLLAGGGLVGLVLAFVWWRWFSPLGPQYNED